MREVDDVIETMDDVSIGDVKMECFSHKSTPAKSLVYYITS